MKKALFDTILALLNLESSRAYHVLDIGCGSGELLEAIGRSAGSGSRLVGIDAMPAAIAAAQARNPAAGYRTFRFGETLPFAGEEFDIVVSSDLLECIVDKEALLQEVGRVLKPQGQVLFAHWDWDTQVYASEQPVLLRQLVHAFADWQQGWMESSDGMMGRKLWGLFQRTKLFDGRIEIFTLTETAYQPGQCGFDLLHDMQELVERGTISAADLQRIQQEMEALEREGAYFYSLNSYIYTGKKR